MGEGELVLVGTGGGHRDLDAADADPHPPYYAQSDAVIVPIRGGGGTRIKILEAFSYGWLLSPRQSAPKDWTSRRARELSPNFGDGLKNQAAAWA